MIGIPVGAHNVTNYLFRYCCLTRLCLYWSALRWSLCSVLDVENESILLVLVASESIRNVGVSLVVVVVIVLIASGNAVGIRVHHWRILWRECRVIYNTRDGKSVVCGLLIWLLSPFTMDRIRRWIIKMLLGWEEETQKIIEINFPSNPRANPSINTWDYVVSYPQFSL